MWIGYYDQRSRSHIKIHSIYDYKKDSVRILVSVEKGMMKRIYELKFDQALDDRTQFRVQVAQAQDGETRIPLTKKILIAENISVRSTLINNIIATMKDLYDLTHEQKVELAKLIAEVLAACAVIGRSLVIKLGDDFEVKDIYFWRE